MSRFQRIIPLLLALLAAVSLLTACAPTADPPATGEEPFGLSFRGEILTVEMEAEPLIARLGTDYTLAVSDSCAGQGEDRLYTYPSVRLYVFAPVEGTPVLTGVAYTDDGVATAEGLRLGSGREEILEQLGDPAEQTEERLVYRVGNVEKVFRLRDGIVVGIELTGE